MKIIELEIHNIRGLRDLSIRPEGNNFVIYGPNGSGKSTVVDALDFLLTGQINRLKGKGTGDITLSRHGPHINCSPEEAQVRAIIKLSGSEETIEISRCMDNPSHLNCSETDRARLAPILALAKNGQHILTRREILRFVTAEGGSRAKDIQELLSLSDIEDTRLALVKVANDLDRSLAITRQHLQTAQASVAATLALPSFDKIQALQKANQSRRILGGEDAVLLTPSGVKQGLVLPAAAEGTQQTINVTSAQTSIQALLQATTGSPTIEELESSLKELIATIRSNPQQMRALDCLDLLEQGLDLLDDNGACPLCETPWPANELAAFLHRRIDTAEAAKRVSAILQQKISQIRPYMATTLQNLRTLIPIAEKITLTETYSHLKGWATDIEQFLAALDEAIKLYPINLESKKVARCLAPATANHWLADLQQAIDKNFPAVTPEQAAWDQLTRLEENLKTLQAAETQFERQELAARRGALMRDEFGAARDLVLGELYHKISERFVEYYKIVHGEDEADFQAELRPNGPALDFQVGFHGRGTHPPHALHSEGHQDSMGLCLYLALVDHLMAGRLNLVVLDDVVMSVDQDHRRQVGRLIRMKFPDLQFLITTHDQTWFQQLQSEGVVSKKNQFQLTPWQLDTGSKLNRLEDLWELIEDDLQRDNVPGAAHRLRRGGEAFFAMICDALHASVPFRLDGRYEFGDLVDSATNRYKTLLKEAKKAAQSRKDLETVQAIAQVEALLEDHKQRRQSESWAINANVHFNRTTEFSLNDFRPVVKAYQDLFGMFQCAKCGTHIRQSKSNNGENQVQCVCGEIYWDLTEKAKD